MSSKLSVDGINSMIKSVHYFNLADAVKTGEKNLAYYEGIPTLKRVTICVLVLHCGFVVIGESACLDFKNFDKHVGELEAKKDALYKLWSLVGFHEKQKDYEGRKGNEST